MERQERIEKLAKCQHNPIKDIKVLEAFSDDGLTALEAHCASQTETFEALETRAEDAESELKTLKEKTAADGSKIKTLEADLKAAKKPLSADDWYKLAPAEIKTLVEKQKKADEEKKESLVETLKAAQDVYDEESLKAMSIEDLEKTTKLLKLDEPPTGDFSAARRVPRAAAAKDDIYQNPPDPYAPGIKRLQEQNGRTVN
jgi:chaperonin cofactor prefoldin